jgi:hypothetical protein
MMPKSVMASMAASQGWAGAARIALDTARQAPEFATSTFSSWFTTRELAGLTALEAAATDLVGRCRLTLSNPR